MADRRPTLEEVRAEIQKLDPSLTPHHRYYDTAVFMVAALLGIGQSDVALSRFTGFSRGFLVRRIRNLRREGVWGPGTFNHTWYEKGGSVEFRLDLKAAEGELEEDDAPPDSESP